MTAKWRADSTRIRSALSQLRCPTLALELGCGDDPTVAHYFAARCPSTLLIALDHNLAALSAYRISADPPPPNFKRGTGDAVRILASITALPFAASFDLIIARHPDIHRHRADWQTTFACLAAYLSPGGHILVTTYSVPEADQLRVWLNVLTADGVLLPNLAPPSLTGRDGFILCYRSRQGQEQP